MAWGSGRHTVKRHSHLFTQPCCLIQRQPHGASQPHGEAHNLTSSKSAHNAPCGTNRGLFLPPCAKSGALRFLDRRRACQRMAPTPISEMAPACPMHQSSAFEYMLVTIRDKRTISSLCGAHEQPPWRGESASVRRVCSVEIMHTLCPRPC